MPVDPSQLSRTLDTIKSQYKDAVRSPLKDPTIGRIPTGDPMLDWAIGGGIPLGRWSHFYGGYGSAKSLTAWNVIRNAQQMGKVCVYYNAEKQFDKEWAIKWGVNVKDLIVIDGTVIEELGEQMEALVQAAHVHVVDSVPATVSQDELAANVGDWQPGISARAWGKVLRRVQERFDDKENAIILINHVSQPFGRGGEEPKGAKFIEYMSSLSLHFRRSSWLFHDKNGVLVDAGSGDATMTGDKEPDGIEFQVRAAKTRVSKPNRTARMRLDYVDGSFDPLWALSRAAIHFKLLDKKGSWYSLKADETIKGQGDNGIRKMLLDHPNFKDEVEELLRATT